MELLIAGTIAGILLALALARVVWIIVGQAVDNLFDWTILHFGNESAARQVEEESRQKEV